MKTIIAGSRDAVSYAVLLSAIKKSGFDITEVVSGGAKGADALGERWAADNNIPIKKMPADWSSYGKGAGIKRNGEMADYVVKSGTPALIALWDGHSHGTKNMIELAKANKMPVYVAKVPKLDLEGTLALLARQSLYYRKNLLVSNEAGPVAARKYLIDERGFTEDTLDEFQIGFAPLNWGFDATDAELAKLEELEALYINDGKYVDAYYNRITFPIRDEQGQIRGFSGRTVGASSSVKYFNSAETEVFSKSNLLFGLSKSRESIFKKNKVILCEGFTDVMAFHQSGIKIAVASMGTHLTPAHLISLGRYTNNIVFAMDMDTAGIKFYNKSLPLIQKLGFNHGKFKVPEGQDPCSFLLGK
jgi:DNA primase catalytic core